MPIKCLYPLTLVLFSTRLYKYRIALRPNISINIGTSASPLRLFIINFSLSSFQYAVYTIFRNISALFRNKSSVFLNKLYITLISLIPDCLPYSGKILYKDISTKYKKALLYI